VVLGSVNDSHGWSEPYVSSFVRLTIIWRCEAMVFACACTRWALQSLAGDTAAFILSQLSGQLTVVDKSYVWAARHDY